MILTMYISTGEECLNLICKPFSLALKNTEKYLLWLNVFGKKEFIGYLGNLSFFLLFKLKIL